jgi:hypothetical protein
MERAGAAPRWPLLLVAASVAALYVRDTSAWAAQQQDASAVSAGQAAAAAAAVVEPVAPPAPLIAASDDALDAPVYEDDSVPLPHLDVRGSLAAAAAPRGHTLRVQFCAQ